MVPEERISYILATFAKASVPARSSFAIVADGLTAYAPLLRRTLTGYKLYGARGEN